MTEVPTPQTKERPLIPNILAERYASTPMLEIWSPDAKILMERDFWIAVMRAQAAAGYDIPQEAIESYERVKHYIDIDSIRKRELDTRHDVKARIEEFNALAGYQYTHIALTSRDDTDNVEQMQVKRGLILIRDKSVALLKRMSDRAVEWEGYVIAGRSHFMPAQPTTIGKRVSNAGEDFLIAFDKLESFIETYPLRGIKGPVGTQMDQLNLLGSPEKVAQLESAIANHLGFSRVMNSVGQVYPRSLDFNMTSILVQLSAGPGNLAKSFRLMAGLEQMTEGFKEGQTGSTAMPWKMNSRSSERINGLIAVLCGYNTMTERLIGDQWLEGDVNCSVPRRIALPDSHMAFDGLLETTLTVLDECGIYPTVVQKELNRYLPFIGSTNILIEAVKRGVGRETAHKAIKENAVAVALIMRQEGEQENDLLERLADDPRLPLSLDEIQSLIGQPVEFVGTAFEQINKFSKSVSEIVKKYPDAANYEPEPIL